MGTIVIARPLDAETQSLYNMTVQVADGTNTATTQVGVFLVMQTSWKLFLTDVTSLLTLPETLQNEYSWQLWLKYPREKRL